MIKSNRDLDVCHLSYKLVMDIFQVTRKFPKGGDVHNDFSDAYQASSKLEVVSKIF
jgi:hypothetical protein